MMATRNTPRLHNAALARLRSGLLILGQAALLVVFIGALWAYLIVADALMRAPQPEERCFDAVDRTHNYCRSQHNWR